MFAVTTRGFHGTSLLGLSWHRCPTLGPHTVDTTLTSCPSPQRGRHFSSSPWSLAPSAPATRDPVTWLWPACRPAPVCLMSLLGRKEPMLDSSWGQAGLAVQGHQGHWSERCGGSWVHSLGGVCE